MVQAAKNIDLPVSKPAQVLPLLLIRGRMYSFIASVLCTCIFLWATKKLIANHQIVYEIYIYFQCGFSAIIMGRNFFLYYWLP